MNTYITNRRGLCVKYAKTLGKMPVNNSSKRKLLLFSLTRLLHEDHYINKIYISNNILFFIILIKKYNIYLCHDIGKLWNKYIMRADMAE